jgi:hypothetical protein
VIALDIKAAWPVQHFQERVAQYPLLRYLGWQTAAKGDHERLTSSALSTTKELLLHGFEEPVEVFAIDLAAASAD